MWTNEEAKEVLAKVKEKAAYDPEFRKLVLNNPDEAIEEVAGKEVPEDVTIKFIESDEDADMTFVLPPLQDEELDEEELDEVAGGCTTDICFKDYF